VADVSERIRRRVGADFSHHVPRVTAALAELTSDVFEREPRDSIYIERIQVAALILAQGHLGKLDEAVALGRRDWRDLLVAAGLGDEGWQELVETELLVEPAPRAWLARTEKPGRQRPGS
jgi:hypothetical protein